MKAPPQVDFDPALFQITFDDIPQIDLKAELAEIERANKYYFDVYIPQQIENDKKYWEQVAREVTAPLEIPDFDFIFSDLDDL